MTAVPPLYSRVKELRGNHGHEGRRIYTVPPAKHNLPSKKSCREGSSVATQGKNLLNIPIGPSKMLDPGDPAFCSTPKRGGGEKDAFANTRQGKRPGQFTRIRDLQRKCVKVDKKASGREVREKYGGNKAKDTNYDKISTTGMVFGKATTKNPYVPILGKNSESRNSEKENQQLTMTGDNEDGCKEHRECVKISSGMCAEEEVLRERCLQGFNEKDKVRKRHLRQYHQQLQQCWPLSASSSHVSLSEQTSHPPPSTFQQTSNISAPDLMCSDLEKELKRRLSVWIGGNKEVLSPVLGEVINVKSKTRQTGQENAAEVGAGDLSVSSKEGTMREEEGTKAGYGSLRKTQEQKSKEGDWSAGREGEGEWRWAWAASSGVAQMDVGTEVKKDDASSLGYNSDDIEEEGKTVVSTRGTECLSTTSSCCNSEPLNVLLFQTNQRIDPSFLHEEERSNFQLYPLENGKGGRKDDKGLSFLSHQAKGLGSIEQPGGRRNKCSLTYERSRIGRSSLSLCLNVHFEKGDVTCLFLLSRDDKTFYP